MATIIAMMAPMNAVPQNRGMDPKAPDDPAWSARIAVCGLQVVPNRNSVDRNLLEEAQRFEQQRQDDAERRQDRDQRGPDQSPMTQRSTPLRARKSTPMRRIERKAPSNAKTIAMLPPIAA